jgi:stage III sporulation protein AB
MKGVVDIIKIFGAVIIIFACGFAGVYKGQCYAKRPIQIRKIRSALQNLESEISWAATPLPEALNRVGLIIGNPINKLFIRAGCLIEKNKNKSVGELWEAALIEIKSSLSIGEEEIEVLKSFGYSLGNTHKDEQIKNINLVKEHLKSLEIKAEAEKNKYEKMYRTLGFLLGMALTLVLI